MELSLKRLLSDTTNKNESNNVVREKIMIDINIDQGGSNQRESKFTSHNVLWLDKDSILLTSRAGEIFQINLPLASNVNKINLKANSNEDCDEKPFELIEENQHYKTIYFMTIQRDIFISIGIDRKVCFWRYNSDTIMLDFSMNCLGAKVNKIIKNPLERQYAVLLTGDSTIRVWDTSKKNNRFQTLTLWKNLTNKQITQAALHPIDEGVLAFSTNDDELSIYDIYTHT